MKSAKCLVREDSAAYMKGNAWMMTLTYCYILKIFDYIVFSMSIVSNLSVHYVPYLVHLPCCKCNKCVVLLFRWQ